MLTTRSNALIGFTLAILALLPSTAPAEPSSNPAVDQVRQPTATPSAESEYDRGVRARLSKDWKVAVEAQRSALALRPAFPEAWNELGFALRNQAATPSRCRPTTRRSGSGRISRRRSNISARPT